MDIRYTSRGLPILSGETCRLLHSTMSLRSRPWPTLMSPRFYVCRHVDLGYGQTVDLYRCCLWLHFRFGYRHDFGWSHAGAWPSPPQHGVPALLDHVRLLHVRLPIMQHRDYSLTSVSASHTGSGTPADGSTSSASTISPDPAPSTSPVASAPSPGP